MDLKNKTQIAKWYLESTSDPNNKWVFPIDPVPFTIGRDKSCHLTLESDGVSRHHAQINVSGEILWVHDSGSTNGTFLNGKQITESESLTNGDILHFGKVGFCVLPMDDVKPSDNDFDSNKTVHMDKPGLLPDHLQDYAAPFKKMIHDRAVVPHYQPILRFSDKSIKGYEILGRLPGNEDLPENPDHIFDIAVSLNMEAELSALFREEGVGQARDLPESASLFVNTHPMELIDIGMLELSLAKIRKLAGSTNLVLEINEKAITSMNRMKSLQSILQNLHIGLAYDDFGVGQSRLVELAKFPPDYLKFDISLIRKIHLAPKRLHQLIVTFLNMARDLGTATIAEGIECSEEGETCRQLGFDYAQGFFYGSPIPISQFAPPAAPIETTS